MAGKLNKSAPARMKSFFTVRLLSDIKVFANQSSFHCRFVVSR